MPRKGENIYKRKDGRWEGRYIKDRKADGKTIYGYVYGHTYTQTKDKLHKVITKSSEATDHRRSSDTFQDISAQWLRSQQTRVKESSYNKYRNLLFAYILPHIGELRIDKITYENIARLRDMLLENGGKRGDGLSGKTVSDTMSVIKNIMKFSQQLGCQHSFDSRLIQVKQSVRELRILRPSEQNALYMYLTNNISPPNVGILISLMTGMRVGEICALRWEDISFADHTIHVQRTMQRIQDHTDPEKRTKIILSPPKSVSGKRIIPIPTSLEEILLTMRPDMTGFVLAMGQKTFTEPRVLQYRFKKVIQGLGLQEVNFHVLRHTFATRCVEIGFDVKSLSEILGHSNVSITMNRYVHPSLETKRENMQRLSTVFTVK